MDSSKQPVARKLRARAYPMNAVLDWSSRDFAEWSRATVIMVFGSPKAAAQAAKINDKSATNWTQGNNGPSGLALLKMMAGDPAFKAEVDRLCSHGAELDPEFQRDMIRLMQVYTRTQALKDMG